MKVRRLQLADYGITAEIYDELRAICLQYPQMQREIAERCAPSVGVGVASRSGVSDPVPGRAEKLERLMDDCRDVEAAAADTGIGRWGGWPAWRKSIIEESGRRG